MKFTGEPLTFVRKMSQGDEFMKNVFDKFVGAAILTGVLSCGLSMASAQEPATTAPDNTKVNDRDRNANEPTADQQKNNRPDRDITKQIREAVEKDKSLSTYAHNVKIITQNGVVTIKGPVRSEEEKRAIEAKAVEIACDGKVNNQLDVKPSH
jgi:hyperosmotically inducible periplasmic protein